MANNPEILKFADVVARVREFQRKSAGVDATDPRERKTSVPTIPEKEIDDTKRTENPSSVEGQKLEDKSTNPHSTGKYKVPVADGTVKDDAAAGADPTKPLSKIAARANEIMNRVKSGQAQPQAQQQKVAGKKAANTNLAQQINPDPEFLFKLAGTILETEGGIQAVEPILRKAAGIEAAGEIIRNATAAYSDLLTEGYNEMQQQAELEKLAAENPQLLEALQIAELEKMASENPELLQALQMAELEKMASENPQLFAALMQEQQQIEELQKQAAYEEYYVNEMLKSASQEDIQCIADMTKAHLANLNSTDDPILKQAYMQGVEDAAAMGDEEDPAAADLPGGGEVSEEDIVEMIGALVESGEIDEATAQQIIAMLSGGGGEAAPGGMGGGEEGMVSEASYAAGNLFNKLVR